MLSGLVPRQSLIAEECAAGGRRLPQGWVASAALFLVLALAGCRVEAEGAVVMNVKEFGAMGDGVTDDAAAISAVVAKLAARGGGVCLMPAGVYLLGTLSHDPVANDSYIVPKDHVSIVGAGVAKTIIRVRAGENARFPGRNAPNVIGTNQASPLEDCRFAGFTVDWDGAHNRLTRDNTRRNNAAIISVNGGRRILVEQVEVKSTPGNQCIFFPAYAAADQGDIVVRNCVFDGNGSAVPGNYNSDHSSVYLNGDHCRIENCRFTATTLVQGTCFEIHGSDSSARGVEGANYQRGFYVASDYEPVGNITVSDSIFRGVWECFDYSAPRYPVNDVRVENCRFAQAPDAIYTNGQSFANGTAPMVPCDRLTIIGCGLAGKAIVNCRLLLLDRVSEVVITGNDFSGFGTYGIWCGGDMLRSGNAIDRLTITCNRFHEISRPIFLRVGASGIGHAVICDNSFTRSGREETAAIDVDVHGGTGLIADNAIASGYALGAHGVMVNFHSRK
jgi:hypothetical protein